MSIDTSQHASLPSCTIVIEWENAIDVEDVWADRAVAALERELALTAADIQGRPVVTYLFDRNVASAEAIKRALAAAGPKMRNYADIEILATDGLSYYELKNYGAARAKTEVSIFLDSDAAPESGWLRRMLEPFNSADVMAVGGITVLSHEDFLARTLALVWIFHLYEERHKTASSWGIYANNTAVRTSFFRQHPFPKINAFKYSCVFWLRSILADGHKYVRVPDALTTHAPHPSIRFMLWRAWTTGLDRDFYVSQTRGSSRWVRGFRATSFFFGRWARGWFRILRFHRFVGLPLWQVPGALAVGFAYSAALFAGQIWSVMSISAATRRRMLVPKSA